MSEVRLLWLASCLLLAWISPVCAGDSYDLAFSTYFGGSQWEHARDVYADAHGNIYVPGSSDGPGWPTKNAYQGAFKAGFGDYDAGDNILAKLVPARTITLNPGRTYQTIRGWEAVAYALEPADPAFPNFRDTLIDQAVNDLGINRVRLEIRSGIENSDDTCSDYQAGKIDYQTWRSRRYATVNDNADPCSINWSGFQFSQLDNTIDRIITPLQKALAAKGEKLIVNVNYVAFTSQITTGAYIHNNPAEYAEFVLATYLHLKEKYGWVPDLWEILLEPDNVSQWNGKLLGQAIVAAANRLKQAGILTVYSKPTLSDSRPSPSPPGSLPARARTGTSSTKAMATSVFTPRASTGRSTAGFAAPGRTPTPKAPTTRSS